VNSFYRAIKIVIFTFIAAISVMIVLRSFGLVITAESMRFVILLTLLTRVIENQIRAEDA